MGLNKLGARRSRKDVWLLRAVALVISLILWMTVIGGEKVEIVKSIQIDYQLPDHLMISNQAPREIQFRVSGPRAFIKEYEARTITRPVDLMKAQQGEYEVLVNDDLLDLPLGLHLISLSSESITVKLDRAAWKRVPVRALFSGQLPEGFRVANVALRPSTVELRGPESRLKNVEAVNTEGISLSGDSLTQVMDVKINMKELPGIFVDENQQVVNVTANLEGALSRKWFRDLPVKLRLSDMLNGRSLAPLRRAGLAVTPAKVSFLIEGPDEVVERLDSKDLEVWAELNEIKEGIHRIRLDWGLPPELRVVRRSTDWVEVKIP